MDPKIKHYTDLYPEGNFIDAERMGDGKPTLKIRDIEKRMVAGKSKTDPPKLLAIMFFEKTHKGMSLCKTNVQCLVAMFGPKPNDWIGRRITLFAGEWKGEPAPRIWGSPDIDHTFEITVVLKNRQGGKEKTPMVMHKTGNGAQKQQPPTDSAPLSNAATLAVDLGPAPPPDDDPDYVPELPEDSDPDNAAPMREPGED